MAKISQRTLKCGALSFTAEIRLRGFPHTSKTFRTKTEAKLWAQEKEADMRAGRHDGTAPARKKTLADAIRRFRETPPTKGAWLQKRKKPQLLKFWEKLYGDVKLADLRTSLIVDGRDLLRKQTTYRGTIRSPAGINRYLSALSVILQSCVEEWGWLERNPCRNVRRLKESNGRTRFLSDDERTALLAACAPDPDLHDVVLLALATGGRRSELRHLLWPDVDLKDEMLIFRNTKNGDDRTLPLAPQAVQMLKRRFCNRKLGTGPSRPSPSLRGRSKWPSRSGVRGVVLHHKEIIASGVGVSIEASLGVSRYVDVV